MFSNAISCSGAANQHTVDIIQGQKLLPKINTWRQLVHPNKGGKLKSQSLHEALAGTSSTFFSGVVSSSTNYTPAFSSG
eukprot:c10258_g1_i1 orf=278-514(-)